MPPSFPKQPGEIAEHADKYASVQLAFDILDQRKADLEAMVAFTADHFKAEFLLSCRRGPDGLDWSRIEEFKEAANAFERQSNHGPGAPPEPLAPEAARHGEWIVTLRDWMWKRNERRRRIEAARSSGT